jgi:DNA-binding GntR family transcriptional regulator
MTASASEQRNMDRFSATSPRPTARGVMSDLAKDHLLQAILSGRYPPGARIVETRVAQELGMSQAPVREALRDLGALGIVEIAAFRGARVRWPTAAELHEAFEVRAELEVLGANLALPRLREPDFEGLAGYVYQMRQATRAGDAYAQATADTAFHQHIIDVAGNGTLTRVWRTLEPFSRTYITMVAPGVDRLRIADLHVPVVEALRSRDPRRTEQAVRQHFSEAAAMLGRLWTDPDLSTVTPHPHALTLTAQARASLGAP